MSEVPNIAGVDAWPLDEMAEGTLRTEAYMRLHQREEIVNGDGGIVLFGAGPILWCEMDTETNWRALVHWLRMRDGGE